MAAEEEEQHTGDKRTAEAAEVGAEDDGGAAKQAKVDVNPLTGVAYTPRFYELLEQRQRLPAWAGREEFLKQMANNQVVCLVGETGSGKTTQLPQILLDAGYHVQAGQIKSLACIQPYDLSAISAAIRIAEELEVPVGSCVGYHVKFDDKTSNDTLLRLISSEAAIREVLVDPLLQRYSVVLIDEAHMRTAAMDAMFGILKRLLPQRPELKVVVLSPSLEIKPLQNFFGGAPLLRLPGKVFPVDVLYMTSRQKNYLKAAISAVMQIHCDQPEGDVLLFLTNEEEVDHAVAQLRKEAPRLAEHGELVVVPLHQSATPDQMTQAFALAPAAKMPGGRPGRKVVVATQCAESAVAVDNIVYVVDTGFEQRCFYNPRTRCDSRQAAPITRNAAERRACRAGRHQMGKCFRLYPEKSLKDHLVESAYPEVMRSNLASLVLALKRLAVEDLAHFDLPDPPPPESLMRALETLSLIGCLDEGGALTQIGNMICTFPVDPLVAKMLLEAPVHRCSNEALSIAAMLCVKPVFLRPPGSYKQADEARSRFAHLDGDHLTLLNVFHAYKQHVQDGVDPVKFCGDNFLNPGALRRAEVIREQLKTGMDFLGLGMASTDFQDKEYYPNIRRCLLGGFFTQVAYLDKPKLGVYLTMREGQETALHPMTTLSSRPQWVLFDELVSSPRSFVKTTTTISGEWLLDIAPNYYNLENFPMNETRAALEKLTAKRGESAAPQA